MASTANSFTRVFINSIICTSITFCPISVVAKMNSKWPKGFAEVVHRRLKTDALFQLEGLRDRHEKYSRRSISVDPAPTPWKAQQWLRNHAQRPDSRISHPREENVFSLHSNPSATKVIYLDFTGRNISNTIWNKYLNTSVILAPPFDMDGNPSTFSIYERNVVYEVWQAVSEDFSPFRIDVTTEYPGSEDFLIRLNYSDDNYGIRVLISPVCSKICEDPCSGIASLGTFSDIGESSFHVTILKSFPTFQE